MWVVWATARHRRVVMSYFMGDTTFAAFLRRYPDPKRESGQVDYFRGAALVNYGAWQVAVVTGIAAAVAVGVLAQHARPAASR